MLSIVVLEDYDILREELVFHLSRPGWHVTGLGDGVALDQYLSTQHADVVVLDLNLPGEDGVSIAQRLRQQHPDMGLIMLTARSAPEHRAKGFTAGADVYLTKPAQTAEIEAVIQNMQRRIAQPPPPAATPARALAAPLAAPLAAHLRLHTGKGQLILPNATSTLLLNPIQTRMLQVLAWHHPAPVSLQTLCQAICQDHAPDADPLHSTNLLRVNISRLRAKWYQVSGNDPLIEPVHKTGYRLTQAIDCIDGDPA